MKQTLIVFGVLLLIPLATLVAADAPQSMLDLALEPPVINTRPGPEYDDRVRVGNMVIGIERTPKGRLWACWATVPTVSSCSRPATTAEQPGRSRAS